MSEETRAEREQRLVKEYGDYVQQCKLDKVGSISYMNWSFNQKMTQRKVEQEQKAKLETDYTEYVAQAKKDQAEVADFVDWKVDKAVVDPKETIDPVAGVKA